MRARAASVTGRLLLFAGGFAIGAWILTSYGGNDFAHYWLSSRLLLDGRVPYGVPLGPPGRAAGLTLDLGVRYATSTPAFLVLFEPLAALPPRTAYLLWALVQLASLAAVLVLSLRLVEDRVPRWGLRLLAGLTVVGFSVWDHFFFSQTQLLLMALVLAALHLSTRGRHGAAVLLVTAAGLLKLYPLALLPWFVGRAWRERAGWGALLPWGSWPGRSSCRRPRSGVRSSRRGFPTWRPSSTARWSTYR